MSNESKKTWEITINNYTPRDIEWLQSLEVSKALISKEVGENGTPHLQGQITFKRSYRLAALKKLHPKAHWEVSLCTQDFNYGNKINSEIILRIDNSKQGKRNDLDEAINSAKNGATVRDLWMNHPNTMIRYSKGILSFRDQLEIRNDSTEHTEFKWPLEKNIKSLILWGKAGIGKTIYAKQHFKCPILVSQIEELKKFDKNLHDGIIFDDMSFKHLPREAQIHLLDWDDNRTIYCRYENVHIPKHTPKIFTTNVEFGEIFNFFGDPAIHRRLLIKELKNPLDSLDL